MVLGTSVFPLNETSVLGDFWGRIKGAKYRFAFQDGTRDILIEYLVLREVSWRTLVERISLSKAWNGPFWKGMERSVG